MRVDQQIAQQRIREVLADTELFVRGVLSGHHRRANCPPTFTKARLRPVDLKNGRRLQVIGETDRGPVTRNIDADSDEELDDVLQWPFANWHLETTTSTVQIRVTKKGHWLIQESSTSRRAVEKASHDRAKDRLIDTDDPLFQILGAGADKRRQVDAFLRQACSVIDRAFEPGRRLRIVDLGCGNAYLTFAAHRYFAHHRPGTVTFGVELRDDLVEQSQRRAHEAGLVGLTFGSATIADATLPNDWETVDVVLALHACDTATDDALAWAVNHDAAVVLAAPCCHQNIQHQLRDGDHDDLVTRSAILRERFADVLTDALRAHLLTERGYDVDVTEFVDSRHTPRNAMIRAVYTGRAASLKDSAHYDEMTSRWGVLPVLAKHLNREADTQHD